MCKPSYRLLVPSNGHDILEDIDALLDYIASADYKATWPDHVKVDLNNVLVLGSSAGGYLARQTAIRMTDEPRPGMKLRGLVVYFGMGGNFMLDRWLTATKDLETGSEVTEEPLKDLQDLLRVGEISDVGYTLGLQGWEHTQRRVALWEWFTSHGLLLDVLAGTDGRIKRALQAIPSSDCETERLLRAIPKQHLPLFPQLWFEVANNCKRLPPCFFIHGTSDDDVPIDETLYTVAQLKKAGKPAADRMLYLVEGGDHELWTKGTKQLAEGVGVVHEALIQFIQRCCCA